MRTLMLLALFVTGCGSGVGEPPHAHVSLISVEDSACQAMSSIVGRLYPPGTVVTCYQDPATRSCACRGD